MKKPITITVKPESRLARKVAFIKALARFLVENQAGKNVALQLESKMPSVLIPWAKEWADLRDTSTLFGYPTVEGAEEVLTELLM